jgi:protein-tyrosine phosphatase
MDRNAVHVLASDAHDTEHRKPVLAAARDAASRMFGQDIALALVEDNPRAIVRGDALPYLPEIDKKR